jgi:hypothetical protein
MIAEDHAPLAFVLCQRADEEVFANLYLCGAEHGFDFAQSAAVEDVPAFHRDDLIAPERFDRKQAAPVYAALPHTRFRRYVRQIFHDLNDGRRWATTSLAQLLITRSKSSRNEYTETPPCVPCTNSPSLLR